MTIDKAIKINTKEILPLLEGKKIEWQIAFQLGIEALERLKANREGSIIINTALPSETQS